MVASDIIKYMGKNKLFDKYGLNITDISAETLAQIAEKADNIPFASAVESVMQELAQNLKN